MIEPCADRRSLWRCLAVDRSGVLNSLAVAEYARRPSQSQALEPKLDRLTIEIGPAVPRVGLSILRDGLPVSAEELGLAVPVDPGDHAVIVSSPGRPQRTLNAH